MITFASTLPAYKEHYADTVAELFHDSEEISPILASFDSKPNTSEGGGRKFIQTVAYSNGQTASATFSTWQAKAQGTTAGSSPGLARFEIDAVELHGGAVLTRQAIDGAEGDSDKIYDVLDEAMARGTTDMRNQLAVAVCERGWGRIGTLTAVTSTTFTIDPSLTNRLEIGADVVFAAAEATGDIATSTPQRVTGIDVDAGVITCSGNPDTDADVGYVVFRDGNRWEGAEDQVRKFPTGLRAWLDHTSASAVLHGVTRTGNPKLLGYRVDATDRSHSDALLKMASQLNKHGSGASDTVFVSDEDFFILASDKDVQKNVPISMGKYEIGFTGIGVLGPNGKMIKVLSDSNLEKGVAYMGPWNSADLRPFLFYNGKALINIDDKDGQTMTRLPGSTSYEIRLYFRGNAVFPGIGKFGVIYNLGVTS